MPRLPTIVARALSAIPTTTFSAAIPRQVTNLPAPIATTTVTASAIPSLVAVPRHVPKLTAPKASPTAAAADTIPSQVSKSAAIVASTAAGIAGPVAIPSQVAEIAALVASSSAAIAVTVVAGGERGAVGAGDVERLGLVAVAGDGELDAIAVEEGAEAAVRSDGGVVDEEVVAAVVGLDEAEALGVVEPLHHAAEPVLRH